MLVAILSSTVINVSGEYSVEVGIAMPENIKGLPHYVGHPDTRKLIDTLGAEYQEGKLFNGLAVGESFLAVPLANPKREAGWTVDQALGSINELRVTKVTRTA